MVKEGCGCLIPMIDLNAQYLSIKDEIDKAIKDVLESSFFILGENVKKFEEEFSKYCDAKYGIGVASGTAALKISLLSCGITRGDEVITTPLSAVASSFVITHVGATPIFVDINKETYNIDEQKVEEKITKKTKAILPVHLYGHPCDMDIILEIAQKHNLKIIEDACQAHGAEYKGKKVGTLSDVSAFSFYPTKNLGAFGDGGLVITNNETIAEKVRLLRDYGQKKRYEHLLKGFNSRLDELHAAVLRVKLKKLDEWNEKRRKNAEIYTKLLKESTAILPVEKNYAKHVFHQYVIRSTQREDLRKLLASSNVMTDVHYPIPIPFQKAYSDLGFTRGSFPIVEKTTEEIMSLPIFPGLKMEEIEKISTLIKSFIDQ